MTYPPIRLFLVLSSDGYRETIGLVKIADVQSKEARAVKMVITIAVVFIVTNFPSSIHTITAQTLPGFTITGRYSRLYQVCGMMFVGLNAVNSGSNVIIYVKMSNKFRQAMLKTFGKSVN